MSKNTPDSRLPQSQNNRTLRLAQMAVLAAVSIVLVMLLRIPMFLPFLEYDMADIPVLLGAFTMGPAAGLTILLTVSVIQAFLLGGNSWIGLIMHFVATGTLLLVASSIYRGSGKRTWGLLAGLVAGTVSMAAVMAPLNFIFIPKLSFDVPLAQSTAILLENVLGLQTGLVFSEVTVKAFNIVKGALLTAIIPFNLVKAGINSVAFFIIFKSLRLALKDKFPQ